MKKRSFFAGFICAILVVCIVGSAMATTGSKAVEIVYKNIKITLNGETVDPKDANGNTVEPFIINGTTYLPIRAISEALGLDVEWDSKTNTVVLTDPSVNKVETPTFSGDEYELKAGEVFTKGCYVVVDGVKILYNGETFEVYNQRSDIVRVTVWVVGVKSDGTTENIQTATFRGLDVYKYNKDMAENGWAIEDYTNMVRAGDALTATMVIDDYSWAGAPKPDIDDDGYYDIKFVISPQTSEDIIRASTSDPVSAVYKLKAN